MWRRLDDLVADALVGTFGMIVLTGYSHYEPHSSLDDMAPAAFAAFGLEQGSGSFRPPQDSPSECDILASTVAQETRVVPWDIGWSATMQKEKNS